VIVAGTSFIVVIGVTRLVVGVVALTVWTLAGP
jgi:hypothetical protein